MWWKFHIEVRFLFYQVNDIQCNDGSSVIIIDGKFHTTLIWCLLCAIFPLRCYIVYDICFCKISTKWKMECAKRKYRINYSIISDLNILIPNLKPLNNRCIITIISYNPIVMVQVGYSYNTDISSFIIQSSFYGN